MQSPSAIRNVSCGTFAESASSVRKMRSIFRTCSTTDITPKLSSYLVSLPSYAFFSTYVIIVLFLQPCATSSINIAKLIIHPCLQIIPANIVPIIHTPKTTIIAICSFNHLDIKKSIRSLSKNYLFLLHGQD